MAVNPHPVRSHGFAATEKCGTLRARNCKGLCGIVGKRRRSDRDVPGETFPLPPVGGYEFCPRGCSFC
eukprot:4079718-Pyramimonas_sp.AAC.1